MIFVCQQQFLFNENVPLTDIEPILKKHLFESQRKGICITQSTRPKHFIFQVLANERNIQFRLCFMPLGRLYSYTSRIFQIDVLLFNN